MSQAPTQQPSDRLYSISEYLEMVDWPAEKYEYVNGRLVMMAGGSGDHALLASRVIRHMGTRLEGKPCEPFGSDLKVRVQRRAIFRYPDVTVICGEPSYEDGHRSVATNPKLIVEVTSESTEHIDRVDKFREYIGIDSLEEYVIVSHREPAVDVYFRQGEGTWLFSPVRGIFAVAKLRSLGIEFDLNELYRGISFPPSREATSDSKPTA
ncbi:MAG: Uma2 family endonuclease [Tepidisphaeraceae bacterium]